MSKKMKIWLAVALAVCLAFSFAASLVQPYVLLRTPSTPYGHKKRDGVQTVPYVELWPFLRTWAGSSLR